LRELAVVPAVVLRQSQTPFVELFLMAFIV
jgi:hypothetical protein